MRYSNVQFIAWCIHTGPRKLGDGVEEYAGLSTESADIAARVELVARALDAARDCPETTRDDPETLKVFMLPEFFFRGSTGAYSMDGVQALVAALQARVKDEARWAHWLFVFGSTVGKSFQTRPASFFERLFGPKYVIDTSKPIEAYNYVLVQKGGFTYASAGPEFAEAVLKRRQSGMDFIPVSGGGGGIAGARVHYLPPTREYGTTSEVQVASYDGNSVFVRDQLTLGVEICLDHAAQRLKKASGLPPIDLQLVPSCGMTLKADSLVARSGGYAFNCDGYANYDTGMLGANSRVQAVDSGDVAVVAKASLDLAGVNVAALFARGAGEVRVYPALPLPKN